MTTHAKGSDSGEPSEPSLHGNYTVTQFRDRAAEVQPPPSTPHITLLRVLTAWSHADDSPIAVADLDLSVDIACVRARWWP